MSVCVCALGGGGGVGGGGQQQQQQQSLLKQLTPWIGLFKKNSGEGK